MRILSAPVFLVLITLLISCQNQSSKNAAEEQIITVDSSFVLPEQRPFKDAHASTLLCLPNSSYLVAWFGGTKEKHNDVGIWLTKGDGVSWSYPKEVAKIRNEAHWNPVLFQNKEGEVTLFFKVGAEISIWETWYIKSTDNGETWSNPVELVAGDRGGRGPVRNKPIVLSNGDWISGSSDESGIWRPFVDISKDDGKTWTKSEFIAFDIDTLMGEGMIQPTLWESTNGHVHMLLRSSEGAIFRSDSDDNGVTWNKAYPTNLPNPNSGIDLVKLPDNSLALLYNPDNTNWGSRGKLNLAISKDNGKTWVDNMIIENGAKDDEFSYPAIVSCGEEIALTYTWNRSNIAFKRIQLKRIN